MIAPTLVDGEGFKVRFEQHPGYLRAYVHDGRDSLDVSIAMWKLLGEQCRLFNARRLLVLEDLEGTVDVAEVPKVIDAMIEFGFADIRCAFVELASDQQGSEHGAILLTERGMRIHVGGDEFAARHWLMYGD